MARWTLWIILIALFFVFSEGKSRDPYKVLGVDRQASQRDIQKAFHRLSLQYHPDKNKNKGAQEKFAEINNAYEILSDEDKKKNYDLYGDEKGAPGFDGGSFGGGNYGDHGGYSYFTGGGPNNGHFTSQPGGSHSFSFSFGGNPTTGGNSFDFGFNDLFSNFFGASSKSGPHYGGFSGSSWDDTGASSHRNLPDVDSLMFRKEIVDKGLTWLLLYYTPKVSGYRTSESLIQDVSLSFQGALKVGRVNCQKDESLCRDHGVWPPKVPRIFVYSYKRSEKGELVDYRGELDSKNLKAFCQDQLPLFSTRHSSNSVDFYFTPSTKEKLPQVLLLSTKKETPIIWRVLSGLYRKRFKFHDAQVFDITDERVKRFKISSLPAVVGKMSNGEEHVLKAGIGVKDLSSGIEEMKGLLIKFEQMNKKAASDWRKESSQYEEQDDIGIPILTSLNVEGICSETTPLCIVGAFGSTKVKEKMKLIFSQLSRKTITRRQSQPQASKDSISFSLLDATKNRKFLESFDDSSFRSSDQLLLAYKPRKGKFAIRRTSELTVEEVEGFVGSALNGDLSFSKIRRKPTLQ